MRLFAILLLFWFSSILASAQDMSLRSVKNIRVDNIQDNKITLSLSSSFNNTTGKSFGVSIKKGKIYKNGDFIGTFKLLDKVRVQKVGTQNVDAKILITLKSKPDLFAEGLSMLAGRNPEIKFTGVFKATKFIYWKRFPFEFQERISLKNLF